jgi:hypothetical protein
MRRSVEAISLVTVRNEQSTLNQNLQMRLPKRIFAYPKNGIQRIKDYRERKLSYYSLRYYAITYKTSAGVDVAILADIAGTGITHIQNHYLHTNQDMHKRTAMRNVISERVRAVREFR